VGLQTCRLVVVLALEADEAAEYDSQRQFEQNDSI
jgi:hypothetical protein